MTVIGQTMLSCSTLRLEISGEVLKFLHEDGKAGKRKPIREK
jgi:hypothetical protein